MKQGTITETVGCPPIGRSANRSGCEEPRATQGMPSCPGRSGPDGWQRPFLASAIGKGAGAASLPLLCVLQHILVEPSVSVGHPLKREIAEHPLTTLPSEALTLRRIVDQLAHGSRVGGRVVAMLDQQAPGVADQLAIAGERWGDDRGAHRHCLVDDIGNALEDAGHQQQIARGIPTSEFTTGRMESKVILETPFSYRRLYIALKWPIPDNVNMHVPMGLDHPLYHTYHQQRILLLNEAARKENVEAARSD